MKRILTAGSSFITVFLVALLLSGCFGEKYTVVTKVNKDGSIDRTISQKERDSTTTEVSAFHASEAAGWTLERVPDTTQATGTAALFTKHFASAEDATRDAQSVTGGYPITSRMEESYSWFFTASKFSETYPSSITFDNVSLTEYFTDSDLAYMKAVSLGDTVLRQDSARNAAVEKKYETYLLRGFVETFIRGAGDVMRASGVESRWIDSLSANKQKLLNMGNRGQDINEVLLVSYAIDSLRLPVAQLRDTLQQVVPDNIFESIFDEAHHTIIMPYAITGSNSSNVMGHVATWKVSLGTVQELELYVETRKMNWLEIGVTILALSLVFVFLRRKK